MYLLNEGIAIETDRLESIGGSWNVWCSGEMHRYHTEHQKRRQAAILHLTLMHESVGIEQD